ncbi:unnamed protein product [Lathyrus oleraceus]
MKVTKELPIHFQSKKNVIIPRRQDYCLMIESYSNAKIMLLLTALFVIGIKVFVFMLFNNSFTLLLALKCRNLLSNPCCLFPSLRFNSSPATQKGMWSRPVCQPETKFE